jgi:hypothetical protein
MNGFRRRAFMLLGHRTNDPWSAASFSYLEYLDLSGMDNGAINGHEQSHGNQHIISQSLMEW